jgi:TRAP-type mannitol/chloroaromatic compound transport system permease large subunit
MLLFTMKSVAPKEIAMQQVFAAVTPYLVFGLLMLAVVIAFPPVATWLPKMLFGR